MLRVCTAALALLLVGCASPGGLDGQRQHAYVFGQPELLATQLTFGVGNAVTLLGEACIDDTKATDSYAHWGETNQAVLAEMTDTLAAHYRIPETTEDLQQRVAEAMHLKTRLTLSTAALSDACTSLPDTLALPSMDLAKRYEMALRDAKDPNTLKPQKLKKTDDREEQTRSE